MSKKQKSKIVIQEEDKKELLLLPEPKKRSHLTRHLPTKVFVSFILFILCIGIVFSFGLNYILNIQYQLPKNPFLAGPVTTAPKSLRIDLDQPDDNLLVFESSIILSGKTIPNTEILVFTDTQDFVTKSKSDGIFSTVINLDEGVNRITAVVFDQTGDSRSQERTVYFSKEKI